MSAPLSPSQLANRAHPGLITFASLTAAAAAAQAAETPTPSLDLVGTPVRALAPEQIEQVAVEWSVEAQAQGMRIHAQVRSLDGQPRLVMVGTPKVIIDEVPVHSQAILSRVPRMEETRWQVVNAGSQPRRISWTIHGEPIPAGADVSIDAPLSIGEPKRRLVTALKAPEPVEQTGSEAKATRLAAKREEAEAFRTIDDGYVTPVWGFSSKVELATPAEAAESTSK